MKATRLLPALAAAAALALAPGLALADPGNGKGNGITNNPQVPPGQSTQDTSVPQPPSNADFTDNGVGVIHTSIDKAYRSATKYRPLVPKLRELVGRPDTPLSTQAKEHILDQLDLAEERFAAILDD